MGLGTWDVKIASFERGDDKEFSFSIFLQIILKCYLHGISDAWEIIAERYICSSLSIVVHIYKTNYSSVHLKREGRILRNQSHRNRNESQQGTCPLYTKCVEHLPVSKNHDGDIQHE